jgi:hypothetical protein
MDTTIFSKAPVKTHSNFAFLTALAPALTTSGTSLLSTACFGDEACQQNRELQSQVQLTTAQANLAATQVAAMQAQHDGAQNKALLYVCIAFGVVVLVLGAIFLLKKNNAR